MRRVVVVLRNLVLVVWAVGLVGCELRRESKPSILVVAVEGLDFDSINCDSAESEDQTAPDFQVFCQEAVRFSHAFSPTPMSQASLASLMTGLYPFDHGVHHNGSDFLSSKFQTLAEGALSRGYRTLFVSGGVPIWRKSGLAQGFEVFDDSVDLGLGEYYRPAREVFKIATTWFDGVESSPFLGVLFLADLQFPQIATRTQDGEVREKSSAGQLAAVGESLRALVKNLKDHKRWNSTYVVLVGLNSLQRRENQSEPSPLSLRSNSVQVTLFIKPARREGDNLIQWAVDRNVSLVDVGLTMFSWLGLTPAPTSIAELRPEDLNQALVQSEPTWRANRIVASETAWPNWLEGSGVRWALRQNQFLYVYDTRPLIFNTLTDRMETLPLKVSDPLWNSLSAQVVDLLNHTHIARWSGMHTHWLKQIAVARELWNGGGTQRTVHGGEPWARWYLRRALGQRNWHEVKRLASEGGDSVGVYAAGRGMGENPTLPPDPCLHLVLAAKGAKSSLQSECEDEKLLSLHAWQVAPDDEKTLALEKFMRIYATDRMDQELGRMNYVNELRWDVDRDWPTGPSDLDYVLTLKEFEPLAKKISSLASGKDSAF